MSNKFYERSLRNILNDYSSEFNELLGNNDDISNHYRNISLLVIEDFEMKKGLTPPMAESLFKKINSYKLCIFKFVMERKHLVWSGNTQLLQYP